MSKMTVTFDLCDEDADEILLTLAAHVRAHGGRLEISAEPPAGVPLSFGPDGLPDKNWAVGHQMPGFDEPYAANVALEQAHPEKFPPDHGDPEDAHKVWVAHESPLGKDQVIPEKSEIREIAETKQP